jgi:hypothetical protein
LAGVGAINEKSTSINFKVRSLKQITGVIIPHFDKYPLITQKRADYLLFREVVMMKVRKEHLTEQGLLKIVAIRASMNKGLSDQLSEAFPHITPILRPLISSQVIPHPEWMAGFTSGEGCFLVLIRKSKTKTGFRVSLRFNLGQHVRDEELFNKFIEYFDGGNIYHYKEAVHFIVEKFSDIEHKILPFFNKYPILGEKSLNFEGFSQVASLMREKKHLTPEGLDQIQLIKAGLNKGRKYE